MLPLDPKGKFKIILRRRNHFKNVWSSEKNRCPHFDLQNHSSRWSENHTAPKSQKTDLFLNVGGGKKTKEETIRFTLENQPVGFWQIENKMLDFLTKQSPTQRLSVVLFNFWLIAKVNLSPITQKSVIKSKRQGLATIPLRKDTLTFEHWKPQKTAESHERTAFYRNSNGNRLKSPWCRSSTYFLLFR